MFGEERKKTVGWKKETDFSNKTCGICTLFEYAVIPVNRSMRGRGYPRLARRFLDFHMAARSSESRVST
jgi:hypothetical protein